MDQFFTALGNGIGTTVGTLAESGILFIVFGILWIAFAAALLLSQGSLDAAWNWIGSLPFLVQVVVWVLFLPVVAGLWVWHTAWPDVLRLVIVAGLAGWTLLIFPKPWK